MFLQTFLSLFIPHKIYVRSLGHLQGRWILQPGKVMRLVEGSFVAHQQPLATDHSYLMLLGMFDTAVGLIMIINQIPKNHLTTCMLLSPSFYGIVMSFCLIVHCCSAIYKLPDFLIMSFMEIDQIDRVISKVEIKISRKFNFSSSHHCSDLKHSNKPKIYS